MTITLNLAPEDEAQLNGIAARQGQNADKVAYTLFAAALAQAAGEREESDTNQHGSDDSHISQPRPVAVWDAAFRAKYNIPADLEPLSEEELRSLDPVDTMEAIHLGMEDSLAGRMTSAAEWKARFRARHHIPENGQPMSHEEAKLLP